MNTSQKARRRPMVLFVVIFAVMDFLVPAMSVGSQSEAVGMFLLGLIAGQFALLSIWAVLGPQPVLVRWPLMLLTAMGLLLIVFLGAIPIGGVRTDAGAFLLPFCWLPLIFLAAQSPLWILRLLTGCRIVDATVDDRRPSNDLRQFDLRQMFVATTAIAVILAVGRLSFYFDSEQYRFGGAETHETQMWFELLIVCLSCAVWSALVTIPCLGAVFVVRNLAVGLIGVIVYVGIMTWPVATGLTLISNPGRGESFEAMFGFTTGLATVLLCSLHLLRAAGYRLLWVRRKSAAAD